MAKHPHGRVALVTGASSGIGYEVAHTLAAQGYTVYGASRRGTLPPPPEGGSGLLHALVMDVGNPASIHEGVNTIYAAQGRVDVLVHAAGSGLCGPTECCTAEDAAWQMDTSFYGALRLINELLPGMRKRKSGLIVMIGSAGGIFPIPYQGLYSASKAAMGIYAEAMRLELRTHGVRVSIVEPGDVKTNFTAARKRIPGEIPPEYEQDMKRAVSRMERDEQNGMPAAAVAKTVLRVAERANPPGRVVAGCSYKLLVFIKRLLPARLVEWLLYRMYLGKH